MQSCKHKNLHEIRFFHIQSEPFQNVVLNKIHIRYLDIRPMSKHTYPIPHWTPMQGWHVCQILSDFVLQSIYDSHCPCWQIIIAIGREL